MPKIILPFTDEASIPKELLPYKTADNKVEMWVGDTVAEETNPSLAKRANELLDEKKVVQTKYDNLLTSSSEMSTELKEAKLAIAKQTGITPEDKTLLDTVKGLKIPIEQITEAVQKYPEVSQKAIAFERETSFNNFFPTTGYKNSVVLKDLLKDVKDFKVVDSADKKSKVPMVVIEKEGKVTEVALSDFEKTNPNWDSYTPALMNGNGQQQGQTWVKQYQSNSNNQQEGGVLNAHINAMNKNNTAQPGQK